MPTKREREYYRMGFKDGVESERYRVRDPGGQIRYAEQEIREEFQERGKALRRLKPKRKLSAWNKFVKANSKKKEFRYRDGKLNLKKMGVAFRRKKRR